MPGSTEIDPVAVPLGKTLKTERLMKLNGEQIKQLQYALTSALHTRDLLRQFVRTGLNENLDFIADGDNLSDVAFKLIEWMEARGRLWELVEKAFQENSGNPDLNRFVESLSNSHILAENTHSLNEKDSTTPHAVLGTTRLIAMTHAGQTKVVRKGQGYFYLHVKGAQAVFSGSIWEHAKTLIVTSQVSLNFSPLGREPFNAIQRSFAVTKGRTEQIGLKPNLINLVPAMAENLSVSIDFLLDTENQLAGLSKLINEDTFAVAISCAPEAAMTARILGRLSQKLLQTFNKALQFRGDFDLSEGLQEGYYVILGSRDEASPIPLSLPEFEVHDGLLFTGGQPVVQWSYVILKIGCMEVRTRDLNDGAAWDKKLKDAEAIAMAASGNYLATAEEKKRDWQLCLSHLKEAQTLLLADPNYIPSEARSIIQDAFANYSGMINTPSEVRSFGEEKSLTSLIVTEQDRRLLDIAPEEDLQATRIEYLIKANAAKKQIREEKLS